MRSMGKILYIEKNSLTVFTIYIFFYIGTYVFIVDTIVIFYSDQTIYNIILLRYNKTDIMKKKIHF